MGGTTAKSAFWRGVRDTAPMLLVIVPFGMVFGAVGAEAGLAMAEILGFSLFVIAGASQVAAVQLMIEGAPAFVVLATALTINLRMAMYSAALAPHFAGVPPWQRGLMAYALVDHSYAASALEYERRPGMTVPEKVGYFAGAAMPLCLPWVAASWAGAVVGQAMPPGLGLDFAVPITFLALLGPMLRSRAHWAAAAVSVGGALALIWVPFGLGLLIAAAAAMVAGAAVEARAARVVA